MLRKTIEAGRKSGLFAFSSPDLANGPSVAVSQQFSAEFRTLFL